METTIEGWRALRADPCFVALVDYLQEQVSDAVTQHMNADISDPNNLLAQQKYAQGAKATVEQLISEVEAKCQLQPIQ